MATRMRNAGMAPFILPASRGAWDAQVQDGAKFRLIESGTVDDSIGAGAIVTETSTSDTHDVLFFMLISRRLAAQTIDGTLQINCTISTEAGANAVYHVHAWVTQGDTANLRGTLLADHIEVDAREVPETSGWFWSLDNPVTLSGVTCQAGDHLVVEIGVRFRNTTASDITVNADFLGTSGVLTDAPEDGENLGGTAVVNWIEFSDDITELAQMVRVTQAGLQAITQPAPGVRVTQVGLQALTQPTPGARVTQLSLSVLRRNRRGRVYGTIVG